MISFLVSVIIVLGLAVCALAALWESGRKHEREAQQTYKELARERNEARQDWAILKGMRQEDAAAVGRANDRHQRAERKLAASPILLSLATELDVRR